MADEKRGPGQPKKPTPEVSCERIHELIHEFGRTQKAATEEVLKQHRNILPSKPRSRLTKAYRLFKKKIGDQPLDEYTGYNGSWSAGRPNESERRRRSAPTLCGLKLRVVASDRGRPSRGSPTRVRRQSAPRGTGPGSG